CPSFGSRGADGRTGLCQPEQRQRFRPRLARRRQIWAPAEVAAARGRAWRGAGLRRAALRQERHPRDRARIVQTEFHARPQRTDFNGSKGARMSTAALLGKYRGTVTNNIDPLQIGRIQVMVADVAGFIPGTWAMPCLTSSGINTGLFTVPLIGGGGWRELERGNPDFPIWVGGYWGSTAEVPVMAKTV